MSTTPVSETVQEKIQRAIAEGQAKPVDGRHVDVLYARARWRIDAYTWVRDTLPGLVRDAAARGDRFVDIGPNKGLADTAQEFDLAVHEIYRITAEHPIGYFTYEVRW